MVEEGGRGSAAERKKSRKRREKKVLEEIFPYEKCGTGKKNQSVLNQELRFYHYITITLNKRVQTLFKKCS